MQIASGTVGAMIIEGDFAEIPEIAAAKERLLMLTEAVFDSFGKVEDFGTLFPETAARFIAVNGVREPTITMRPGEVQRWRPARGLAGRYFIGLDGHTLNPVARDGIPLARMGLNVPRKPDQPTDYPKAMLMAPGQRIDVLVQAGEPGSYALRAVPYYQGYAAPIGPMARLVIEGDPLPMSLPANCRRCGRSSSATGRSLEPARSDSRSSRRRADGVLAEFRFTIDGKTFDPDRVDQRVRLGAVEEWTIINDQPDDHVFHIHTNDMLLTKINGEALEEPIWRTRRSSRAMVALPSGRASSISPANTSSTAT